MNKLKQRISEAVEKKKASRTIDLTGGSQRNALLAGFLIILFVGFLFWDAEAGREDMKDACNIAKKGASMKTVNAAFKQRGWRVETFEQGKRYWLYVKTARGLGRYFCSVEHNNKIVVQSRVNFE